MAKKIYLVYFKCTFMKIVFIHEIDDVSDWRNIQHPEMYPTVCVRCVMHMQLASLLRTPV